MDSLGTGIVTILVSIIGVATLGVILSKQSNTANVISTFGTAFSGILKAAVSPISSGV